MSLDNRTTKIKSKEDIEKCEGCSAIRSCGVDSYYIVNGVKVYCPCMECLVKMICREGDGCYLYNEYLDQVDKTIEGKGNSKWNQKESV